MNEVVTANIIVIGNEILSGRTQDLNIAFLAKEFSELGIKLSHVRIIPDIEKEIINNVNELRKNCTYLFTTGGIGPTHDDITSASIAKAFSLPLIQHPEALKILESHYQTSDLNESRLRMANTPQGANLLYNPISKAPGFNIDNVYVLPGVPNIMQAMFNEFKNTLTRGEIIHSHSIKVLIKEGTIAKMFSDLQEKYPDVEMGSYPFAKNGEWGTELVLRSTNHKALQSAYNELKDGLENRYLTL